jgi:hypothetical protein
MNAFLANKAAEKAKQNYNIAREKLEKAANAYGWSKTSAPRESQAQVGRTRGT